MSSGTAEKHHYIPCFYTRQWSGADGRLCEFSRHHGIVKPRMTHPKGTGYAMRLYSVDGVAPEHRNAVEERFMRKTDQLASDALQLLLKGDGRAFTVETKSGWSRFIMSLMQRNPQKVEWARRNLRGLYSQELAKREADYDRLRGPADPPTFAEFKARMDATAIDIASFQLVQTMIDMPNVGQFINGMSWSITTVPQNSPTFLTSDRPVVMSNGLARPEAYIFLPIGPRKLFVAVHQNERHLWNPWLDDLPPPELTFRVNNVVASQAEKYVYGIDDGARHFVAERLGSQPAQFIGGNNPDPSE